MNKKELSKKYYFGTIKTIGIYILASIACLLYKHLFLNTNTTILGSIKSILNFSAANYSWYIEMYLGLFLLIPFLNLIYNNLKSKKHKQFLILTMLILTSIPTITNIYNLEAGFSIDMFFSKGTTYNKVLPFWWKQLYPITYYFIGSYLKEYKIKLSQKANISLFILAVVLSGTYNYICSYNRVFIWGPYQDWGSLQNVITTVLLFNFIINLKINKIPKCLKLIINKISDLSLGTYLVSYIFDNAFYKILNINIAKTTDKLPYFIIMVLSIFICSIFLSFVINFIYSYLYKQIIKIIKFHKNK